MGYISLSGLQPTARRMQVASDYILTQIVFFFNSKRLFFYFFHNLSKNAHMNLYVFNITLYCFSIDIFITSFLQSVL